MVNTQYLNAGNMWLAIAIGNTRIKAAVFQAGNFLADYAFKHTEIELLEEKLGNCTWQKVAIASVVTDLITPWHNLTQTYYINNDLIPISRLYTSMGVDRSLSLWGAGTVYGCPVLVIDAGTALTISGLDDNWQFKGGAILPGLQMQLRALQVFTSGLPLVEIPTNLDERIPARWASDTTSSIQSGVIYSLLASVQGFSQDWLRRFPNSNLVITGGDATVLSQHLQPPMICDRNLIFWGMRSFLEHLQAKETRP